MYLLRNDIHANAARRNGENLRVNVYIHIENHAYIRARPPHFMSSSVFLFVFRQNVYASCKLDAEEDMYADEEKRTSTKTIDDSRFFSPSSSSFSSLHGGLSIRYDT